MVEQAALKLRTAKLELLKTDFLDFKSKELADKIPSNEDLFQLNIFHNAVSVESLNQDDIPNLNFADVFKGVIKIITYVLQLYATVIDLKKVIFISPMALSFQI